MGDKLAYERGYTMVIGVVDDPFSDDVYDEWDWQEIAGWPGLYTWYYNSSFSLHAYLYGDGQISEEPYGGGPHEIVGDGCPTGGTWLDPI